MHSRQWVLLVFSRHGSELYRQLPLDLETGPWFASASKGSKLVHWVPPLHQWHVHHTRQWHGASTCVCRCLHSMGASAMAGREVDDAEFPAPHHKCRASKILVYLYCDNTTAISIFQDGHGMDNFITTLHKAPVAQLTTLHCLTVGHIAGDYLTSSAEALSLGHKGQHYNDCVNHLEQYRGVKLITVHCDAFQLCKSL